MPDPHLHEHAFVFNATFDENEKRWKALQCGQIKTEAGVFQSMFSMRLAQRMRELGYVLAWDGERWEIAGVSREVIDKFSRRTTLIEAEAAKRGIRSAEEKAKLGAKTREKKGDACNWNELVKSWRERASPDTMKELAHLYQATQRRSYSEVTASADPPVTPRRALEAAVEKLSTHASVWTRRDMLVEALNAGRGHVERSQIEFQLEAEERLPANQRLLQCREFRGERVYTTAEIIEEERVCVELARTGKGTGDVLGSPTAFDPCLSEEQRAAAMHILASKDFVSCLHGKAGTGKTTLAKTVVSSLMASGRHVFTVAPTNKAVGVLQDDGFAQSTTLQKLLLTAPYKNIPKGSVIWVDEAGLVGSKDMMTLLRLARAKECRIVLVGDIAQHTSVARGDALRLLIQRAELQPARVRTIRRQTDIDYKQAVQHLADANENVEEAAKGLKLLERRGSILSYADANDRFTFAAKRIAALVRSGESHLAIAPTHREIASLTKAVRQELMGAKLIDEGTARSVEIMASRNLTKFEKAVPWLYDTDDQIELLRDTSWAKRGDRFTVAEVGSESVTVRSKDGTLRLLNLNDGESFCVYKRASIELAKGDRVRITKSCVTKKAAFCAGEILEVKGFADNGNILLGNDRVLPRDFGHLDYGWATTSIASQGATVDHVVIVQSAESGRAASLKQLYVSASRGTKGVWIFTDDGKSLVKAAQRTGERTSALEVFMPAKTESRAQQVRAQSQPIPRCYSKSYSDLRRSTPKAVAQDAHGSETEVSETEGPRNNVRQAVDDTCLMLEESNSGGDTASAQIGESDVEMPMDPEEIPALLADAASAEHDENESEHALASCDEDAESFSPGAKPRPYSKSIVPPQSDSPNAEEMLPP